MLNSFKGGLTDLKESQILKKRQLLRNNEYYTMQDVFDRLYERSCKNFKFRNLMQYIFNENNILLAFRNIKKNKGSTTVGTDNVDISHYMKMETDELVSYFKHELTNYVPRSVKRVVIPKANGKTRPLGIP